MCIHSGGKAVIRAVEKGLNLPPETVEPSKMTLYRFGNTSSSSTWYQFQYLESKGRMKKGQKIWQICLGSGFKCNSAESKYKYYDLILLINLKCTSIESKVMIKYLDYKHRFQDAY